MEWISVKNRLPETNIEDGDFMTSKSVLARFKSKDGVWYESVTLKLFYDSDEPDWYYDYDLEIVLSNNITHWCEIGPLKELTKPQHNQRD